MLILSPLPPCHGLHSSILMGPPSGILGPQYHSKSSEVRAEYLLRLVLDVHLRSDPEPPENRTPPSGDGQTPQSHTSSQTLVGTSAEPDTGYRTSFKRKRGDSPSDSARNVRFFVAGADGDSLPHYLTVSLAAPHNSRTLKVSIGSRRLEVYPAVSRGYACRVLMS